MPTRSHQPRERRGTVLRDGVRLSVREWSGPDGQGSVLLLHGLASTSHIFDLVAPQLSRRRRVVAYDQRGHGESSKPSAGYGFATVAADAREVIRARRLGRPLVVGHSWGASVALEVAARYQRTVGGAVLIDGGFMTLRDRMDWPAARELMAPPPIDGMPAAEFLGMVRQALEPRVSVTPEIEAMALSLVRVGRDGRIRRRLAVRNHLKILRAMWERDTLGTLRSAAVPVLVLATRTRNSPPEEAAFLEAKRDASGAVRAIGDPVRFEWIEGIHDVPLQRPRAVARRIEGFGREAGLWR